MRESFNADERAQERESKPTTIGEKQWFPVRLSNTTMKVVRAIARDAKPSAQALDKARRDADALTMKLAAANGKTPPDPLEVVGIQEEIARAEDALDVAEEAQQDASSAALFKQLHQLLIGEDREHPDPEFLEDKLDTRDAGALMTWLMTDGDGGNSSTSGTSVESPAPTSTST